MKNRSIWLLGMVLLLSLSISGCGDTTVNVPGSAGAQTAGKKTLGTAGGVISGSGVTVTVPGSTIPGNSVEVSVTVESNPPAPLPGTAVQASQTVVLSSSSGFDFNQSVTVTMPFDASKLGAGDIPSLLYWDSSTGKYWPVAVEAVDLANHTVTFSTAHPGKYVAAAIVGMGSAVGKAVAKSGGKVTSLSAFPSIDTGFRSSLNGFFIHNFGSYETPGGNCLGMSSFSLWLDFAHPEQQLYSLYREGDPNLEFDDKTARELTTRAFLASSQEWARWINAPQALLPQGVLGYLMAQTMAISNSPVIFTMRGIKAGHAVVMYKYSGGTFYFYDNNFPGEEVAVKWDMVNGFHNFSKSTVYDAYTSFGYLTVSNVASPAKMEVLYKGANAGWSAADSDFNSITISSAQDSSNNSAKIINKVITISQADRLTVSGEVVYGKRPAKYVLAYLDKAFWATPVASATVTGNKFVLDLPKIDKTNVSLLLYATDDPTNRFDAYAGFEEFTINVTGNIFFKNIGFETGTFDNWLIETHTWQDLTPGSFQPGKSVIVTQGIDPLATDIQQVLFGTYALRINNFDNSYHISSATQSAVVPNIASPTVKFKWAAVLEDPNHAPQDQPYVDIQVIDTDLNGGNTTLYARHFYSNDPSYSGWLQYQSSQWKAINWQPVEISLPATSVGHTITIKVTAADCALGGHGGYAYIDGPE